MNNSIQLGIILIVSIVFIIIHYFLVIKKENISNKNLLFSVLPLLLLFIYKIASNIHSFGWSEDSEDSCHQVNKESNIEKSDYAKVIFSNS